MKNTRSEYEREPLSVTVARMMERPGQRGHDTPELRAWLNPVSVEAFRAYLYRVVHTYGYNECGVKYKCLCGDPIVPGATYGHAMFMRMMRSGMNTCARCLQKINEG